jgi:hypothetical protein
VVRKKREVKKLISESKNEEDKKEGSNMSNKKIETNFTIRFEEEEDYSWIGFELDGKYYIGFETSSQLSAIIVSETFFQAFTEEFETS